MEFQSDAQKATYEKIKPWVKEIFGEFATVREDFPGFSVGIGSAFTTTAVYPWGDNDASITTRSYVITGAEMVPDLMLYLLQQNDTMRFGAFGLDKDKDIFFEHTIVGSAVDKEELKASMMAVVNTADRYDDEIRAKWGGQRAIDRTG